MTTRTIRDAHFAFVDVETTGIDPAVARVVEVACQIVHRRSVLTSFESLVDPRCAIPRFATRIHGIEDAHVAGMPTLRELQPQLLDYCDGTVVVAHNAAFDRRFLTFLRDHPTACSYRLATRVVPEAPNHRNQTLGAFFNVRDAGLAGRRPHRALADVIVTRHVFFHCIDRYIAAGYPDCIDTLIDFISRRPAKAA